MNKRERILTIVVGSALALGMGHLVIKTVFLAPLTEVNEQIASKQRSIDEKERTLKSKDRRIGDWRKFSERSLSDNPDKAILLLGKRITALTGAAGLNVSQQPAPTSMKKSDGFATVAINLSGRGTLSQIAKFLQLFYKEPYNVKITGFAINPEGKGDTLSFTGCRIESIVPVIPLMEIKNPVTTHPDITVQPIATELSSIYAPITARNIFQPYEPPLPIPPRISTPPPSLVRPTTPPPYQLPVNPPNPNGRPGDVVGTTVLGNVSGAYVRNQTGADWYKIDDQLGNQMTILFVHPLGVILKDQAGKILYVEIGRNIDQAAPLTTEAMPELFGAYKNRKEY
ncbi:MAG: hypothetical protein WC975_11175 [Phycisphaerae bacterium]